MISLVFQQTILFVGIQAQTFASGWPKSLLFFHLVLFDLLPLFDSRQSFIENAVNFSVSYEFDGVSLDFQFVGDTTTGGNSATDKQDFVTFCKVRSFMKSSSVTAK